MAALRLLPVALLLAAVGCRPTDPPATAARAPARPVPPGFARATPADVEKVAEAVKPFGGTAALPRDGDGVPAVFVSFWKRGGIDARDGRFRQLPDQDGPKEADVPAVVERLTATGAPIALRVGPELPAAAYARLLGMPNLYELSARGDAVLAAVADSRGDAKLERLRLSTATAADVSPVTKLPRLRFLEVGGTKLDGAGFDRLAELPHLEGLRVTAMDMPAAAAAPLWELTGLRSLHLDSVVMADADLAGLAKLTALRSLFVGGGGPRLTRGGVAGHLAGLPELRQLTLSLYPPGFTDADLVAVGRLRAVEHLTLFGGDELTDAGLAHLRGMTGLKELHLGGVPNAGAAGLAAVADLPNLNHLWIDTGYLPAVEDEKGVIRGNGTTLWIPPAAALEGLKGAKGLKRLTLGNGTDEYLAPIAKIESLEELELRWHTANGPDATKRVPEVVLTDAGMAHLRAAKSLRKLSADGARVSDAGLAHLAALTGLAELALRPTAKPDPTLITDAGLDHLLKRTALRRLELPRVGVTDAGVKRLAALPDLRTLDLTSAPVTDATADALAAFPELEVVTLTGTKVTKAGADRLRAARPGLTVHGP